MNIWGLRSNFVDCKSFLESNSPNILALCETNLNDSLILTISVWRISSKHFLFFSVTIFGLSRCLQTFFARRFEAVFKTSSILLPKRLLQVVLKTSWRRLEDDDLQLCLEDVLKASLKTKNVAVKMSWRPLHQEECLIDLTLIGKDSNTHMHGLAVYVKGRLPSVRDVSLANSADTYSLFQMALLHSASYFLFLYQSPSLSL